MMVLAEMLAPFNFVIMKDIIYCIFAIVILANLDKIAKSIKEIATNSSPVEKVNDDKIVNIVDSILDARFDAGCCYEDSNDSKVK